MTTSRPSGRACASAGKIGVILVNTGSPAEPTPAALKRYLSRFLMDARIRPMNRLAWSLILRFAILPKRAPVSAEKYARIWTDQGSPLVVAHERLAEGLRAHYRAAGLDVEVVGAFNYSEPSVASAMRMLREAGAEDAVVLPLYPQSAFSTTGSVSDAVRRAAKKIRWKGNVTIIDDYHDNPVYIRALAASIQHAGFRVSSNDRLMFSYHSIPLGDIEAGDTYELQTGATSLAVANEIGLDRRRWTVSYQCRFDESREWLSPFTARVLDSWAEQADVQRTFVVCPNFAVDCLETLYDIGCELGPAYVKRWRSAHRGIALERGFEPFVYVPCLNKSKAHLMVLASVLDPYVSRSSQEEVRDGE